MRLFFSFTIDRLGKLVISLMVLSGLIVVALSWYEAKEFTGLETTWTDSESSIIQKQSYLVALRGAIGYGGMIHYFKNYVLRREDRYLLAAHRSILEVNILINGYRVLGVSEAENQSLGEIENVIGQYRAAITRAEKLIRSDLATDQTDKLVAVDDEPAVRALLRLTDVISTVRQARTKVVSDKISRMARALNYSALLIGLLIFGTILALAWFLRFRLTRPLNTLVSAIDRVDPSMPGLNRLLTTENKEDELGRVASAINRFLDATEMHLTERRNTEKLLEGAKVTAEKANQAKSEFLSSMSHELRTPMNSILGFSQMLSTDPDAPLNEDQSDSVNHILKSGRHLLTLINDVLDLVKIEASGVGISIENTSPTEIINECLLTVTPMAEERGIAISVPAANAVVPNVNADRTRLKQVLFNLMSNAVKYNRDNGSITVEYEQTDDNMLRISISDTGGGISEKDQGELFRPFNRLGAENTDIQGTGIGLVISKSLIEIMNGDIGMTSEVGSGSTFWFTLPLSGKDDETVGTMERALKQDSDLDADIRGKLLYVEDNPANLELMKKVVDRVGGLVMISAHTGELGIELARQEQPDVILLDINLPGINGIQVLKELQKSARTRHIPTIAVSAAATHSDIERGIEAGFMRYMTKPFVIPEMLATIKEALIDRNSNG